MKHSNYSNFIKQYYPLFLGVIVVFLYELAFFIFGDDSWIRIHDCLDDNIADIKMVIDQGALFNKDATLPLLYGIPRSEYPMSFSIKMLIFTIFPTFWAYVINDLLVRLLAYVGMTLLMVKFIIPSRSLSQLWLTTLISICFAYISFYTIYGLSAAGIPLIIYAFLNLKDKKSIVISYVIILAFALYSDLVLSGLFIGVFLGIYYLYLLFSKHEPNWYYLLGLILLGLIYIVLNIDLFINFFTSSGFVSSRTEFKTHLLRQDIINNTKELFYLTQYHSGTLPTKTILLAVIICCLLDKGIDKISFACVGAIATIFLFYVSALCLKKYTDISLFHSFQFDRFYFMLPGLWMILFGSVLSRVTEKHSILLPLFFICLLIPRIYNNNQELKSAFHQLTGRVPDVPTFKQFYDEDLFSKIAADIAPLNRKDCKVASVGIYPAVALYNGFFTVDGYVANYRLDYKHTFREVISEELSSKDWLRRYYDDWGSRCYVFSSDLNGETLIGKTENKHINLHINTQQLKDIGCQYILSAVVIDNAENLGLSFVGTYSTDMSFWQITVYQL